MDSKVGLLVTPMQLPQLFQATGVQLLGWIGARGDVRLF